MMDNVRPPKSERNHTTRLHDEHDREPTSAPQQRPEEEPTEGSVESIVYNKPTNKKPRIRPITYIKTYWREASKKKRLITGAIILALLVSITVGLAFALKPSPSPEPEPVAIEQPKEPLPPPKPETIPSELTGVEVKPELANLPVTAVTVENSPDARPQSGLADAGVVFEAMVEGSITRFLALYQEDKPEQIGPIRSVRRNHIDWILAHDAAVAHVGGSPYALARLRSLGLKDLDQFQNPEAYRRVNTRFAPHNMYSTRNDLLKVHEKRGYKKSDFKGFVRKNPEPSESPEVTEINVRISSPLYNVRFVYDAKNNTYKRFMGGVPHVDEQTNKQITSDVVVVMVADYQRDGIYSVYDLTGSNTAFIFQDGNVTRGIWEKPSQKENARFGNADGLPIGLNPGKTWVTLATSAGDVTTK